MFVVKQRFYLEGAGEPLRLVNQVIYAQIHIKRKLTKTKMWS